MAPNILFIFMDNLGYDEVGCYGGGVLHGAPTPNIDRLAREGTKLFSTSTSSRARRTSGHRPR
jgi:arylsulfatase A-like enzyme